MKKFAFLLVAISFLGTATVQAKKGRSLNAEVSGGDFWIGLSTDAITQTGSGNLSALLDLSAKTALQLYFGINAVSPFNFGAGGNFKYTFAGAAAKGAHIGGGLGLGLTAAEAFFVRFGALVGLHFELIKSVMFSFDGGAYLNIVTGGGGVSFALAPNGATTLGMSVLFRL